MTDLPLEISATEAQQLLDSSSSILLLDCRNQDEYDLVHIENSTLIPMDQVTIRTGEIGELKKERIVVYCHMGVRSLMVCRWLRENGFPNTQSMAGGIDAWSVAVDPTLRRY